MKKYYPTILFMICLDFFSAILMYEHPLWMFEESLFLPNHTLTDFLIAFFMYPTVVLIFLANYPKQKVRQTGWILLWVVIFSVTEYVSIITGLGSYYNGWDFGWSIALNCIMFPILRLHHSRPLLAWLLCIPIAAFIIIYFNFPLKMMK
ncbi:CBO0543 family protein [Virgibacillus sp. W0181]|uniref:CBO0543 family protein n=1 Tax=Virgibacillus sp. W0181 TaxID=3391581 RepID=UPI003F454BA6